MVAKHRSYLPDLRSRPFSLVAVMVSLIAGALLVTWDAWSDIYRIAMKDEESSHVLLVPIVGFWLFWVRRSRLRFCRPRATWVGPVIALAGGLLHVAGDSFLWQSLWHGGTVLLVIGACLSVLGRDVLVSFLPVFVALVFLVPVPGRIRQQIAVPLQEATAGATQVSCNLIGLPVERSGNLLTINGVDVAVAEACNGMRMTFALLLVSYAFAYGMPLRWHVRLLLVLLSPVSAVLCNVLRLVPTVWFFGNWSTGAAELFHEISGWVMLFGAFLLLMGVIRLLHWVSMPVTTFSLARD